MHWCATSSGSSDSELLWLIFKTSSVRTEGDDIQDVVDLGALADKYVLSAPKYLVRKGIGTIDRAAALSPLP